MKILSRGAEAVVSANDAVVLKQRQPKKYRVKELDDRLRLHRMKREVKVMQALQQLGVPVPKPLSVDEKTATITMRLVEGKKVKDALSSSNYAAICGEIGKSIGIMHRNNIVHGDLTTSNMILDDGNTKVYFVDFGLSLFSNKEEDKAVDLHLFSQALNSSHHGIAKQCFDATIADYKKANALGWKKVLKRLEKVEERGRNKGKG